MTTDGFTAHESGTDAAGRSEAGWIAWTRQAEAILGHSLDGNQDRNGFCLDTAYTAWERGSSAVAHARMVMATDGYDNTHARQAFPRRRYG